MEVFGSEHEFSLVDRNLCPLPIVDTVIKELNGRVVNCIRFKSFSFGKELQSHVAEFKANRPFCSPKVFEENMQRAILEISEFLERKHDARLLGTGMHPLLRLEEAKVWSHRDRKIYEALSRIFNFYQHGWLNIQAFQLNLSYGNEKEAIQLHNALANLLPYVPAISASSPVYESKIREYADSRLHFYRINQKEIPSITGNIIPEYVNSFKEYRQITINRYTEELEKLDAPEWVLNKEWLNSRGAVFRFDRKAIEVRIMDEQECIKADVALSCFIRASLRGMLSQREPYLPRDVLIADLNSVIKDGLEAKVQHPRGPTARDVCRYYFRIALENASVEEKTYLPIVGKRIDEGSLSNLIRRDVLKKAQKTDLGEAILSIYLKLVENLRENEVYS
ncbi:MAG: glutamate-cysteine ligase family protein [Candidatus Bathyarchaeota archaeon]|nr:glutamate-cysteine ligase family protein [Candidatus Bathyarchaeota archaeon]